jgi:hypothetical protein
MHPSKQPVSLWLLLLLVLLLLVEATVLDSTRSTARGCHSGMTALRPAAGAGEWTAGTTASHFLLQCPAAGHLVCCCHCGCHHWVKGCTLLYCLADAEHATKQILHCLLHPAGLCTCHLL